MVFGSAQMPFRRRTRTVRTAMSRLASSHFLPRRGLYQHPPYFSLLRLCFGCTGATSARVVVRKKHRSRTAFVLSSRISPAFQKSSYSDGATCPHRSVQCRYAILVCGIGIRASLNEADNRGCLRRRIPRTRNGIADGGGMEGLGAAAVPGVDVRARTDELADDFDPVRRCGDVQRGIACVDDASNRVEEICPRLRRLTSCSRLETCASQLGRISKQPGNAGDITSDDGSH